MSHRLIHESGLPRPEDEAVETSRLVVDGGAVIHFANPPDGEGSGGSIARRESWRQEFQKVIARKVGAPEPASSPEADRLVGRERFEQSTYGHVLSANELEEIIQKRSDELRDYVGLDAEEVAKYLAEDLELLDLKKSKEQAASGEQA